MRIKAQFLGYPEIETQTGLIVFPFLKAKILALLLIENKRFARDRLCSLLWGDKDPEVAARNLRNALSCLRTLLPVFVADRQTVSLIRDVEVHSDLDFLNDPHLLDFSSVDALSQPYLEIALLDHWPGFSDWLLSRRTHYRRQLLDGMKVRAEGEDAALWYERILSIDPYEEDAHAALLKLYSDCGRYMAVAKLEQAYGRMTDEPFERREPNGRECVTCPSVRLPEQLALMECVEQSISAGRCSFLWGEEGIGKSHLIQCVREELEHKGWHCLACSAIQGEERYSLNPLLRLLSELSHRMPLGKTQLSYFKKDYLLSCFPILEEAVQEGAAHKKGALGLTELNPPLLARFLSEYILACMDSEKGLLIVENVQWLDETSAEILCSLVHIEKSPLCFLFSGYEGFRNHLLAKVKLSDSTHFCEMTLSRLNQEQIRQLCGELYPNRNWDDNEIRAVEQYSEGNPFFIYELLRFSGGEGKPIPTNPPDYLFAQRIVSLGKKERGFIEAASIFPGEIPLIELEPLLELNPWDASETYENVQQQGILKERKTEDGRILYSFTHSRMKEAVRERMTHTLLRVLHTKRIAWIDASLLKSAANRRVLFSQLALHCAQIEDAEKELMARIEELKLHFRVIHELFPLVSDRELRHFIPSVDDMEYTYKSMTYAESLLDKLVREQGRTEALRQRERELLTLRGGYLCWQGKYADAEQNLKEALRKEMREGSPIGQINVCEQLCYIGIQTDNPEVLHVFALRMYRLALSSHFHPEAGMAARFLALCHIMSGNVRAAQRLLQQSIRFFEQMEEQGEVYTLSIVAATHYQGDICIVEGSWEGALTCYLRCIGIVESHGFYRGLGLSLAKASYCYIRLKKYEEAEKFLKRTDSFYQTICSEWSGSVQGGGIAYSLYALIASRNGNWQDAAERLTLSESLCKQMNKPLWRAILLWVKGEMLQGRDIPSDFIERYLHKGRSAYHAEAQLIFAKLGWKHEVGTESTQ